MAYMSIEEWRPQQVADWVRGLEDTVSIYADNFINNGVDGKKLLLLDTGDLENLGVRKIGHREVILGAVDLLRHCHYAGGQETLQTLFMQLGVKATSLTRELERTLESNPPPTPSGRDKVKTSTIAAVVDIISSLKTVLTWLDRTPFSENKELRGIKGIFLRWGMELATTAQRDTFAEHPEHAIYRLCCNLSNRCEELVTEITDPLTIQPPSLQIAILRKRPDQDLGLRIQSCFRGIHSVGEVKPHSPAHFSGKLEPGNEIVQVNFQTVVGWGQRKLVRLMQEDWPGHEVHLTVKKQPCHGVLNTATGFFKPIRLPSLIGTPPLLTGSGTEQRTHTIEPICPSVPPPPKPKEEKEKGGGGGRKSQAEVEEDLEGAQPVAQRASLFRRATVIGLQAKGNEESGSQEAKDSVVEGKGHDAVVDRTVSSPPGKSSAPSKTPTHRLRREEDGKRGGISKELAAISPMKEREKERGSEMQLPASDHIEVKKIVRENVRTYRRPLVRNPALQSQLTVDSLKSSSLYQPPPPPLSKPMAPAFVMNLDTPHASDTGEVARGGDGPQMIVKEDSVTVDGVEYPPVFIPETYSLQRARPPGAGGSLRRHHKPLGPSMPDS